jgi:hypothetical protein
MKLEPVGIWYEIWLAVEVSSLMDLKEMTHACQRARLLCKASHALAGANC